MTTRANIYPLNTTTPVQLTREPYYNVGSGAFVLGELSRGFFGSTDFEIWSAETGGTQLTEGVDYTLGGLNSYYTTLAGQSVYTTVTISNVSYQSGPVYITYKTIGTFTSAPFYNAMQDGSNALMNQGIINGCMRVSTQASASLSTSFQEGEVNNMACKGSGTAVTAGTIEQATAANAGVSGFACKVTGATITGTGIVHLRYRMESKDAKEYKNQNATIALLVYHDVGSAVDYTIYVSKADAEDDFSSVTAIGNNSGQTVSNATETIIYYKDISLGDCSNGIEIEIQAECGAITTKNFEFAEFRISKTDIILPFQPRHIELENNLCIDSTPIGFISDFAGTSAPNGWLHCDGSAISRTQYKKLFAAIGTTWGVGDGSTTFNIPDGRAMFRRGAGTHGTLLMADGNSYAGPAVGSSELDQMQGHRHGYILSTIESSSASDNFIQSATGATSQQHPAIKILEPETDGVYGTPRTGDENRPVAIGVLPCIKAY